jgi:hypothetical protein
MTSPTCYKAQTKLKKECKMAKPNYTFEKRQKELAKKRKKEEKRQRKAGTPNELPPDSTPQAPIV